MSHLLWEYGLLACFLLLWGKSFKNNFTMILFTFHACEHVDVKECLTGKWFFSISHMGSKDWTQQDALMSHLTYPWGYFSACFLCVGLDFNPFVFLIFLHEVNFHELEADLSDFTDWALPLLFGNELEHTAANLWRFPGSVPFPTSCRLCSAFMCSLSFPQIFFDL